MCGVRCAAVTQGKCECLQESGGGGKAMTCGYLKGDGLLPALLTHGLERKPSCIHGF